MASKKHAKQKQLYTLASIENDSQRVARSLILRGGNLVDVELADGSGMLCEIPSRFSKTIWIKRGDYLIIEVYGETKTPSGKKEAKVQATIVHVLQLDDIKQLKKDGDWPAEFELLASGKPIRPTGAAAGLMGNPNRRPNLDSDDDDDEEGEGEESDEDDDDMDLPPNPNRGMPPSDSEDDE